MLIQYIRRVLAVAFSGEGHPIPEKYQRPSYLQQHPRATKAMQDLLDRTTNKEQLTK